MKSEEKLNEVIMTSSKDKKPRASQTVSFKNKFHCVDCSASFTLKSMFRKHMLEEHGIAEDIDQGIKSFGCPQCGIRLSAEWTLVRHLFVMHGISKETSTKYKEKKIGTSKKSS